MVSTRTVCEFLSSNQTSPGDMREVFILQIKTESAEKNEWYTLCWSILKDFQFFSGVVLVNSKKRNFGF